MAELTINGKTVTVDDSFRDLPPDQQEATVNEIASQMGISPTVAQDEKPADSWRGEVAAGMRGAREAIPFGRDIGSFLKSYTTGRTFEEEKKAQEARDAALREQYPLSYGAGEIGGALASVAVPEFAGVGLLGKGAAIESAAAKKLAPIIGSEAEAKVLSGLGAGMVGGAAQGAVHGLGTGTSLEERLGHAGEEAAIGAPLGLVGAGAGNVLARGARKVGEKLGAVEPLAATPTAEELIKRGKSAYEASKAANIGIEPKAIKDLYTKTMADLENVGFDLEENKKMLPALRRIRDISGPATIEDLEKAIRATKSAASDYQNRPNMMMASIFKKNVNDFLEDLHPSQVIGAKSPIEAVEALQEGREFWKRGRKFETIQNIISDASDRAGATGTGGNFVNLVRQGAQKLLRDTKKQKGYWTADEVQLLREIARGGVGANVLRALSRADPLHHGLIGAFEAIHAISDPIGSAALALTGMGAHRASSRMTRNAIENLQRTIAAGGKKADLPTLNLMESVMGRSATAPAIVAPALSEDREGRAKGGRIGKRDYPAKKLTLMEKAARKAFNDLALESRPLMEMPDEAIVKALDMAKDK